VTAPGGDVSAEVALHCYRHPDRPTGVRCVRCERPICGQCMVPASVGFQCPQCVVEGRRTVRAARTVYGGRVRPNERPGLVTLGLIAINVVVFVITAASGGGVVTASGSSTIYEHFALIPPAVAHGEWWRLVSAAFLHYGIFHIGFNMYALYIVGPPLEAALGRLRYVVLYLLAGIGGGVLSVAIGPLNEQAAGASGAIFGLFGALYVVARHRNLATNGITVVIVANLVFTFAIPNIDWRGHVGGLVTGAAIAVIFARAPLGARRDRLQAAGVVVVALLVAAVGVVGVHRVNSSCRTTTAIGDQAYCQYFDPMPAAPSVGGGT
jgi:membrane associated rhomboid family serine protease